ncbi:MAG: transcription antitermination factor NusB [Rickettsiales bacterium]
MSRTRYIAIQALHTLLSEGRTVDEVLPRHMELSEEDEKFVHALLMATLRHIGQLDAMIEPHLETPLSKKLHAVQCALRIGAAQILVMKIPAHAAVGETVQAMKGGKYKPYAKLVNAVLRKIEPAPLPPATYNLPAWYKPRWKQHYDVARICEVVVQPTPLDIIRRDGSGERFAAPYPSVETIKGYHEGDFWVQDKAASMPITMLGDIKGKTVLEIGAAPGGKTAQLCAASAIVTALDRSESRMQRLNENMKRLRMDITPVVADVMEWEPSEPYDIVVIDAPCSATGTWRRHPEVVHITTLDDIRELAKLQADMLARIWPWVKAGGQLLYIVCSLEQEEGEAQMEAFLAANKDATQQGATLRTNPAMEAETGGMDGFFAAILQKAA